MATQQKQNNFMVLPKPFQPRNRIFEIEWDPMKDNSDPTKVNTANPYYHNGKIETENTAGCDSRVLMDRAIPFIRKAAGEKNPSSR